MPAEATFFKGRLIPYAPRYSLGQVGDLEAAIERPNEMQGAGFALCTGGANALLPDVLYTTTGATVLVPDSYVPARARIKPANVQLSVHGSGAWAGLQAMILQDTALSPLVYYPAICLTALAKIGFLGQSMQDGPQLAAVVSYAATTGVITFASATFITTTLAGVPFQVTDGAGKGETGIILSNTATTITPTTVLGTTLDSTSIIAIYYYNATAATGTTLTSSYATWTVNLYAQGWSVVIISGTGAGQVRAITSNTATALTVPTWTTTPDATSNFLITKNPANMGAIDMGVGSHFTIAGFGKGLQIAPLGTATGSAATSGLRIYAEAFFSQ